MAKKVYVLAADGFEEVEGLTVVDLLRRAGMQVQIVSIKDSLQVQGARNINITADVSIDHLQDDGDLLVLPGGMPGTRYLEQSKDVEDLIKHYFAEGKLIAAICAAPTILGKLRLLKGRKATCYPGMEGELFEADFTTDPVAVDLPFITSRGVGTALEFACKLIEILDSREAAEKMAASVVYEMKM